MIIASESAACDYVRELCSVEAFDQLKKFAEMISLENQQQNLIAQTTMPQLWQRHIADSAQLLHFVPDEQPGIWLDLGTGAGFPGLVIAMMRPQWQVRLVEMRRRRIEWLNHCVDELGLDNCDIIGTKLERADSFAAGCISARAFSSFTNLLEVAGRFATAETLWLLPKGRGAKDELSAQPVHIRAGFHVKPSLTDQEAGIIVGRLADKAQRTGQRTGTHR